MHTQWRLWSAGPQQHTRSTSIRHTSTHAPIELQTMSHTQQRQTPSTYKSSPTCKTKRIHAYTRASPLQTPLQYRYTHLPHLPHQLDGHQLTCTCAVSARRRSTAAANADAVHTTTGTVAAAYTQFTARNAAAEHATEKSHDSARTNDAPLHCRPGRVVMSGSQSVKRSADTARRLRACIPGSPPSMYPPDTGIVSSHRRTQKVQTDSPYQPSCRRRSAGLAERETPRPGVSLTASGHNDVRHTRSA